MKISNNHVAFKAHFVNKTEIGKVLEGCYPIYECNSVSFIKIDSNNIRDINALEEIVQYWKGSILAKSIFHAACALKNRSNAYKNHEVFALTAQETNFDKLKSNELLGLTHLSPYEDSFTLIEQLQANPKFLYVSEPDYKGIGTGILNSLKIIYNKLSCYPITDDCVIKFYEKNGFIKKPYSFNYYTYQKY